MKRVTIKDVAEAAGVSASAVSRVFTAGGSASEETRARVHKAANSLGYRPSLLARGLTGNRTNLITLVHGTIQDPFDAAVLETLTDALSQQKSHLMMVNATNKNDQDILASAFDYNADAVIVTAGTIDTEQAEQCINAGLPVIMIGRTPHIDRVDSILSDNYRGGQIAAQQLMRAGCNSPLFIGKSRPIWSNSQRQAGFEDTMSAHGLTPRIRRPASDSVLDVFNLAASILTSDTVPDGIFCTSDHAAIRVMEAAMMAGFRIPADLSVIGYNNTPLCDLPMFRLTSIDYSVDRVVDYCLELLSRRLANPDAPAKSMVVEASLVMRESVSRQIPQSSSRSGQQ